MKQKRYWLRGGMYGACISVLIFLLSWTYSYFFWKPDPHMWLDFSPFFLIAWYMGYPVQTVANLILGEDNFVEQHLLLFSGVLTLFLVGVIFGWLYGKIKNRNKNKEVV